MESFIKKIWRDNGEEAHYQFVRFSKGVFENRAILNLHKTSKIKLKGSFEWANDFVEFVSELGNVKFSGIILSREELNLENEKRKKNIFQYEVLDIENEKINEIKNKAYAMLLDGEGEGIILKIKKKLPKPGKGENKVDDKFCQLELDLKYWEKIKESFMIPECKKCKTSHVFEINQIIIPEGEEDFEKARLSAKRKGKIIRKMEVDKKESKEEKEFVA
jgi:hypothetical protein